MAIAAILTVLAAVLWAGYLYVYNFTKSRYQGWLRAAITLNFLSLAAWLLWLPNGGWWNLSLVLAWIVMFPTVFMLDGYVGDLVDNLRRPPGAEIYSESRHPKAPWAIYFPGANNGAELTSRDFRQALLAKYNVMVVEHPRRDFSYDEVLSDVFDAMRKYGVRNPHFIGHSFGGQIAMTVMREYKRRGCPHGPIGRSVMVCVPVVTSDIKAPLPLSWAQYVKGGPLLNKLVWPWAQPLFRKLGPRQALAPGVDPAWAREHRRFMDKFPVRGCFAQAVEMYRHKAPANGEFADVWALIICTAGEDMFVRPKAVQRLQAAFPNHRVVALPGVHANLVEEAPSYTKAIASFLLANQRVS